MIKLPVKDRTTIPWMSPHEIPAIKLVLSAWRKQRREQPKSGPVRFDADYAEIFAGEAAADLELIAAIDRKLWKESKDAKAKA